MLFADKKGIDTLQNYAIFNEYFAKMKYLIKMSYKMLLKKKKSGMIGI